MAQSGSGSGSTPPRSGDDEKVLSGLEVEALLSPGKQHLFLLFTQSRLILAHHAKTGRGSVPLYAMLGKLADGFTRAPPKKGRIEKLVLMSPAEILGLHPDNFAIEYPRVVSLSVEYVDRGRARITLVTADEKYELYASPVAIEGVREDVEMLLGGKAEYRPLNR